MKLPILKTKFLATLVAATLALPACVMAAEDASRPATDRYDLRIPGQPLSTALQEFAKQSGVQVVFFSRLTEGRAVPALQGRFTRGEALEQLLRGSGLTYRVVNAKTIEVRPLSETGARETQGVNREAGLRLAGEVGNNSTEDSAAPVSSGDRVEEMLVEGEREKPAPFATGNLDLTRTENDVLPFTVFSAREIELSGTANLEEFLRNRLPQNFNFDIPDELEGGTVGMGAGTNKVDLRGWGASETVFLLNGRRMPAEYRGSLDDTSNATPNLGAIPLGSIERIEILTSAGSAIYGANATGGIINIITRQDVRGGQLALSYETPSAAHAPKRGMNMSYGMPLKWGLGLRLAAGYADSEPLRAGERADVSIERWRHLAMLRQPTRLITQVSNNRFNTNSQVFGATPNIRSTSSTGNLFANLSGAQASNFTTVPDNYSGAGLSAFQPGVYNLGLAAGVAGNSLYARRSTLGTASTDASFSIGVDKKISSNLRWSMDYRYAKNEREGQTTAALNFGGSVATPVVPGSVASNPFGQDVQVYMVDPRMDRLPGLDNGPENLSWGMSSNLQGQFGAWRGFLDLNYVHHRNRQVVSSFVEPGAGWDAALASGTYNPFVDTRTTSPAQPGFYEDYVAQRNRSGSASRTYQSMLKFSGPLLRLLGGDAGLTVGGQWSRSDRYQAFYTAGFEDGVTGAPRSPLGPYFVLSPSFDPARRFVFDSYAAYAETSVPLLSSRQGVPLVNHLEVFGSGRFDYTVHHGFRSQSLSDQQNGVTPIAVKYTNDSNLYAFGLRHELLEGLSFRVSRSIGFRPPGISDVTPNDPPTADYCPSCTITDPVRDEDIQITSTMYIVGGYPDLRPETTDSTNLGIVLSPRRTPGLRVSVDYVESVRNDAITDLDIQLLLDQEAEFPGRLVRGAPDGDPSGVGPVVFVDMRRINFRQIASKSADLTVQQQFRNVFGGQLLIAAMASKRLSFKTQASGSSPIVQQIRNRTIGNSTSQQIQWNANGQLQWTGRRWSLGWNARYFDYVLVRTQDFLLQGGDRAPWKVNHDFNLGYRVPVLDASRKVQVWQSGISVTLGVKNVFDREPRFWAQRTDNGIAPYDSIMGRSFWLGMRKDFR